MSRIIYFDKLNVISCMAVVCLHANSFIHTFIKDDWWWLRVFVEVVFYFAVPVFFMLSGANLLNYRERYSTNTFYRKRLLKTFIPFVFWATFFYLLYWINGHQDLEWREVLTRITKGKIPYTNYWFFIPLFLLYIFMPFLSLMVMNMSKKHLLRLCMLLLIFQSFLPTIYLLLGVEIQLQLPISGYFIYLLLGYFLTLSDMEKNTVAVHSIGVVAIVAMILRYYFIYFSDTKEAPMFTYMGVYAFFPAMYIFLCVKRMKSSERSVSGNVWTWLSKRSFGVYLIHTALIMMFAKLLNQQNPWFIPISFIFAYTISVAITTILQKNKFTKFLVP